MKPATCRLISASRRAWSLAASWPLKTKRSFIKLADELRLPLRPHARANGRHVGGGEDEEHPQPLGAAHFAAEVENGLVFGIVAAEGLVRHGQVPMDQENERFAVLVGQPQAVGHTVGDGPADERVILVVAFSQVVQEHRQVQQVFLADRPVSLSQQARVAIEPLPAPRRSAAYARRLCSCGTG